MTVSFWLWVFFIFDRVFYLFIIVCCWVWVFEVSILLVFLSFVSYLLWNSEYLSLDSIWWIFFMFFYLGFWSLNSILELLCWWPWVFDCEFLHFWLNFLLVFCCEFLSVLSCRVWVFDSEFFRVFQFEFLICPILWVFEMFTVSFCVAEFDSEFSCFWLEAQWLFPDHAVWHNQILISGLFLSIV